MKNTKLNTITPKQNEMLQKAIVYHKTGNLDKAEDLYQKLSKTLPSHPAVLANLGTIALQRGQLEKAIRILGKSLTIAPAQASAWNNRGLALKNLKLLDDAVTSFDKAINIDPQFAAAYFNRGNVLHDLKRLNEAVASYDQAIALVPDHSEAYYNRGIALQDQNRLDEAVTSYNRAIAIDPNHVFAYSNRGMALKDLKRPDEAVASYDLAIAIMPEYADAHCNRGIALRELKRFHDAIKSYERAIELAPNHADAYSNLGVVLKDLKRLDDAISSYDRAIALDPKHTGAYSNRGNALKDMNRLHDAIVSYDKAIAINPNLAETYSNRGNALKDLNQLNDAMVSYDQAIAINPNLAEAFYNRGNALKELHQLDASESSYNRALVLKPDYADAYWNKALLKLLKGDYLEGWELYEWGWKNNQRKPIREFQSTLWLGEEPLVGKKLLIYPEQGLGDCLQFIRYLSMVESLGAEVVLEMPSSLTAVVSTLKGKFTVIESGKSIPEVDFHCPIMSLPRAFKTTVETIPNQVPYLYADPDKQQAWLNRLGTKTKPRIGLVWSGSTIHKNDHNRSIPLREFNCLFGLDVEFHSLQKEIRYEDIATLTATDNLTAHQKLLNDFSDTAALINVLDLVITVDTSVAHLAGALGKAVWILLPYAPDFRWMLGRDDTPWYPTARLFRQPDIGDWDSVINNLTIAVRKALL
jgi:tetratricopeptide (TPR) repeat protein